MLIDVFPIVSLVYRKKKSCKREGEGGKSTLLTFVEDVVCCGGNWKWEMEFQYS